MQELVIRDAAGTVINIGPWDLMIQRVPDLDEQGLEVYEPREGGGYTLRTKQVAFNPLPEGATWQIEDVVVLPDRSIYAANDPRLATLLG